MTGTVMSVLAAVNLAVFGYFVLISSSNLVLISLAAGEFIRQQRRASFAGADDLFSSPLAPSVSLLVPAYNEGPVIVTSVQALMALRYPQFDVLVIDDGSTDDTFDALRDAFDLIEIPCAVPDALEFRGQVLSVHVARDDPDRLRVVRKANGGKADALNVGIVLARRDLVCMVDADSVLDNDALLTVVKPFADDPTRVAAVGGVIRIANGSRIEAGRVVDVRMPREWLVRVQIIEYLRAFFTGRTGWSRLGGLVVISGAFGLFRRDVVLELGGMELDTVGEDAELVVRLHRRMREAGLDYRVVFAPEPAAWTQAPSTLQVLGRQRRRWHRGLTEILIRHRDMIGRRRYGLVGMLALPYYVLFELWAPVVELLAVVLVPLSLWLGAVDVGFAWRFLLVAYGSGILVSLCAVILEEASFSRYRRWSDLARGLPSAVLENLGYRQALSVFQLRGMWQALRRTRGGWGAMTRVAHDEATGRRPAWHYPVAAMTATAALALGLAALPPDALEPEDGAAAGPGQVTLLGARQWPEPPLQTSWAPQPSLVHGLRVSAHAGPSGFVLPTAGGQRRFLPGVNLGASVPGHRPGDLAITASDYRRWFAAMGRLGIRVVRVYTLHPPAFYDELAAYDRRWPEAPIYLVQGVHPPDESFLRSGDLGDPAPTRAFDDELRDVSAAVSGDLVRAPAPNRAGGTWRTDVSRWLAGWIIGVEWDAEAVAAGDLKNADAPPGGGRWFRSTADATPTERWLATRLDRLAGLEAARGRSEPLAFVNWPTTDPLSHPREPDPREDLVGVDAEHVLPTRAWPGGTFASYHAYPYYPDFLRYEYPEADDPYAAYLAALRRHHRRMPVLISEFGVPSSIGSAHLGSLGRDQGDHGEREAMTTDAALLRLIRAQGMAGGFVFSWTDEWFKATWNTEAHQQPADRRPLWHDPLTNEQYFGIVATDPLGQPDAVPVALPVRFGSGPATAAFWRADESYLQLDVRLASDGARRLVIGLDTLPDLDGEPAPGAGDRRPDAALVLDLAASTGQAWIRRELDPVPLDVAEPLEDGAGSSWRPYRLVVQGPAAARRPGWVPVPVPEAGSGPGVGTAAAREDRPVVLFDAGRLRYGTFDPRAPGSDSRATWYTTREPAGSVDRTRLRLRIPWALAGFADPSSAQVLVPDGDLPGTRTSPGITVVLSGDGVDQTLGTIPAPGWEAVHYRERLKPGADELRRAFLQTSLP